MLRITGMVALLGMLQGCALIPWWSDEAQVRDQHGCLQSEGYRWSHLLGHCLRPADKAVPLTALKYGDDKRAWVLVSNDNSSAEVYLPQQESMLLPRQNEGDKPMWQGGDWSLLRSRGFVLSEEGHAVFHNYGSQP